MLAFAHIPTGPTATEGFAKGVDEGRIRIITAVPTTVTAADRQRGTLS